MNDDDVPKPVIPYPPLHETVWFHIPDTESGCATACSVWDRRGWHLGFWNGKHWESYVLEHPIQHHAVDNWCHLRLPNERRLSDIAFTAKQAVRKGLNGHGG